MGIRQQQKAARRQKILKAAEQLFAQDGVQKTTVDAIAGKAGLAWATVYKYYSTKDDIVTAVVRPELGKIFLRGEEVIADPPEQPAAAIFALIKCYTGWRDNWRDRGLLRAISSAGMMESSGAVHDLSVWANTQVQTQIRDLLRVLQMRNRVPKTVNIADMALIIYAVFNQEYQHYITTDGMSAEQVFAQMQRLINTLFEPWQARDSRRPRS